MKNFNENEKRLFRELLDCAKKSAQKAYCLYSGFKVGAALLAKSGKVYRGFNIENAAFGECVCAERVAFFNAIGEGEREFDCIAIWGGEGVNPCFPCGSCRQVMREFCSPDFKIIVGEDEAYTLKELLPLSFGPENLR